MRRRQLLVELDAEPGGLARVRVAVGEGEGVREDPVGEVGVLGVLLAVCCLTSRSPSWFSAGAPIRSESDAPRAWAILDATPIVGIARVTPSGEGYALGYLAPPIG